jgi:hypothetical protein
MASLNTLKFLDILMHMSHIFLMLFILFAWFSSRLRVPHIIVSIITGLSWMLFVQSKGFGYCVLTDIHWQILRKLGETNLPETYLQYLYEKLTGLSLQKKTGYIITLSMLLTSLILSTALFFRKNLKTNKIKVKE